MPAQGPVPAEKSLFELCSYFYLTTGQLNLARQEILKSVAYDPRQDKCLGYIWFVCLTGLLRNCLKPSNLAGETLISAMQ